MVRAESSSQLRSGRRKEPDIEWIRREHLFFRMVLANVTNQKLKLPVSAKKLDLADVVTNYHMVMPQDMSDPSKVSVALRQQTEAILGKGKSSAIWSVPQSLPFHEMLTCVVEWDEGMVNHNMLTELLNNWEQFPDMAEVSEASISSLVNKMMDAGWQLDIVESDGPSGQLSNEFKCMKALESVGAVHQASQPIDHNASRWHLDTEFAMRLVPSVALESPRFLFYPPADKPPEEWSIIQLMAALHLKGWNHRCVAPGKAPPPFLKAQGIKFWYTRVTASQVSKLYLLALNDADKVFQRHLDGGLHIGEASWSESRN